jgi:hypothetical protein
MGGPLPSYLPQFPTPFLEQAAQLAGQRPVSYQGRQRAALVVLLAQQPLVSNGEAAQRGQTPSAFGASWATPWGHGGLFLGRQGGTGPPGGVFPLWTTPWSRRSPVNGAQKPSTPCAASLWPTSPPGPARCWAHRSVAGQWGEYLIRRPSNHGGTHTGFFRVIPTSPPRPAPCWTSMRADGKASPWAPRTPSSAPPRRPASRPAAVAIPPCLPRRAVRPVLRTNTSAWGRCNIWRPGTSAGEVSWAGVKRRPGLNPLAGWSNRSWQRHPLGLGNGCFGLWTTARRSAVLPRRSDGVRSILVSLWSILRSTPVGSIRSKSPSLSANARYCPPMTLPTWQRYDSAWPCTKSCRINTRHLFSGSLTGPN